MPVEPDTKWPEEPGSRNKLARPPDVSPNKSFLVVTGSTTRPGGRYRLRLLEPERENHYMDWRGTRWSSSPSSSRRPVTSRHHPLRSRTYRVRMTFNHRGSHPNRHGLGTFKPGSTSQDLFEEAANAPARAAPMVLETKRTMIVPRVFSRIAS